MPVPCLEYTFNLYDTCMCVHTHVPSVKWVMVIECINLILPGASKSWSTTTQDMSSRVLLDETNVGIGRLNKTHCPP